MRITLAINKSFVAGAACAAIAVGMAAFAWGQQQTIQRPALMQLQRQYSGPLQDTLVQRWRDPADGTICYFWLPITVPNAPAQQGLVSYGSNTIGSISCFPSASPR